mmetsp:Transcript_3687/g.5449  ORF Transcript_3687/g.5449 Transcript_3687/m.5449 type:complete len:372 (-) Transcript_3687:48-1163(-)
MRANRRIKKGFCAKLLIVTLTMMIMIMTKKVKGACVMTGSNWLNDTCSENNPCEKPDHLYPNIANTEPFYLPPSVQEHLIKTCPIFNGSKVCCSVNQVYTLTNNTGRIKTALGTNCKECAESMTRMWCDFTCSPNQHEFVRILSYRPTTPPLPKFIFQVGFFVTEKFQTEFWETCRKITLGPIYIEKLYPNGIRQFLPALLQQQYSNPTVIMKFLNGNDTVKQMADASKTVYLATENSLEKAKKREQEANKQNEETFKKLNINMETLILNKMMDVTPPGYDGRVVSCDGTCPCQYCAATCKNPNYKPLYPDYNCKIGSMKCYIVGSIVGGVVMLLVIIAVLLSLSIRCCTWIVKKYGHKFTASPHAYTPMH